MNPLSASSLFFGALMLSALVAGTFLVLFLLVSHIAEKMDERDWRKRQESGEVKDPLDWLEETDVS